MRQIHWPNRLSGNGDTFFLLRFAKIEMTQHSNLARPLIVFLLILITSSSQAQVSSWTGGGGANTNYFNNSNWNAGVPNPAVDAFFSLNGNYSVTINGNAVVDSISIFNGNPSFSGGNRLRAMAALSGISGSNVSVVGADTAMDFGDVFQVGPTTSGGLTVATGAEITGLREMNIQRASTVVVENGGMLDFPELFIGAGVVSGADLQIRSGGRANTVCATIGHDSSASATVSGTSSNWSNIGILRIAGMATGDLELSNNASMTSFDTFVGQSVNFGEFLIDEANLFNVGGITVGFGDLILQNSAFASTFDLNVGFQLGLPATVTVDSTSEIEVDFDLNVGPAGIGSLDIQGLVSANRARIADPFASTINVGATGELRVTDGIFVGNSGQGDLNIDGLVQSDQLEIGVNMASADGTAIVNSMGVLEVTADMKVGVQGSGDLIVNGDARADECIIGDLDGSSGNVLIEPAGSLQITRSITVGENGMGVLTIDGNASAFDCSIGQSTGSNGVVVVRETGVFDVARLSIGSNGTGRLDILQGDVNVSSQMTVSAGSELRLNSTVLESSLLTNQGTVTFFSGLNSTIDARVVNTVNGLISVLNGDVVGELVNDGEISVSVIGRLNVCGDWSGTGEFAGSGDVNFEGRMQPGNGVSTIDFENDVFLKSSSIAEFDIGGLSPAQYDNLTIDGDLTLEGGQLLVTLTDGFDAQIQDGQQFMLFQVNGNQSGTFDGLPEGAAVTSVDGIDLNISYVGGDGNDVVLSAEAQGGGVLVGDVNLDGDVNLLDVAPFVDLISTGTFQLEADINEDGQVNLLDVSPFVMLLAG